MSDKTVLFKTIHGSHLILSKPGAWERYLRTITSFTMTQDPKRKRHGLRLALNMHDFTRTGRFNPTLTPNEVDFVTEYAKKDCDPVYGMAMMIALDNLPYRLVR